MNVKKWNNDIINFCPGIGKGENITFIKIKEIIKIDITNEKKIIEEKK